MDKRISAMVINKHIFFDQAKTPELADYLQQNNILHKNLNGLITFDIIHSDPHWPVINVIIERNHISCISETSFSKKELSSAEWLTVRSQWRNGYPQPEGNFGYQRITYCDDQYCAACGSGLRQVDSFRMKATPKWGSRHFMMLNWVFDELFMDDDAKGVLTDAGFSGIRFMEVKNKNGSAVLPGVNQLIIETRSFPGFVTGRPDVRNIAVCRVCGIPKYHPSGIGMHAFRKEALNDMPDICKTAEIFDWGKSASRRILIRQNVYRAIMENHLERGLVFAPIDLF